VELFFPYFYRTFPFAQAAAKTMDVPMRQLRQGGFVLLKIGAQLYSTANMSALLAVLTRKVKEDFQVLPIPPLLTWWMHAALQNSVLHSNMSCGVAAFHTHH
jgi:hypothetical protein